LMALKYWCGTDEPFFTRCKMRPQHPIIEAADKISVAGL
jgi:hypothetical protein